ncbi:hypothetical protein AB0B89_27165 [Sphaerisporangium sp. NPDC049002]|uniref:hypothetical protein n=1 Tax=Sphaerisporangium sp. NPDC049002 TaxID=3155392 RepID=UPI0033C8EE2E
MAKITVAGESVDLELGSLPLHEALALQKATGMRPPQLGEALAQQDMLAIAALCWLILKYRMGKDVTFDDICDGTYPVDLGSFSVEEDEPEPVGPTGGEAATTSPPNA